MWFVACVTSSVHRLAHPSLLIQKDGGYLPMSHGTEANPSSRLRDLCEGQGGTCSGRSRGKGCSCPAKGPCDRKGEICGAGPEVGRKGSSARSGAYRTAARAASQEGQSRRPAGCGAWLILGVCACLMVLCGLEHAPLRRRGQGDQAWSPGPDAAG